MYDEADADILATADLRRWSSDSSTRMSSFPAVASSCTVSPFLTSASGPPTADSGDTCSTTVPKAVPLMRASDMRTMSLTPRSNSFRGKGMKPASGIPGPPMGPADRMTRMSFGLTSSSGWSMRLDKSAGLSNTTARPLCLSRCFDAADTLMTAPSGASDPRKIVIPPSGYSAFAMSSITSWL